MNEASYQISDKIDDGAIFLVRGDTYQQFVGNMREVINDGSFTNGLNAFLSSVRGSKPATPQQAYQQVQQTLGAQPAQDPPAPWDQPQQPQQTGWNAGVPVQGAPAQQQFPPATTQVTYTCPHGQRIERSGTNARGAWKAYFCPAKAEGCKPMGADGKLWSR